MSCLFKQLIFCVHKIFELIQYTKSIFIQMRGGFLNKEQKSIFIQMRGGFIEQRAKICILYKLCSFSYKNVK